jgi:hypothetical protein
MLSKLRAADAGALHASECCQATICCRPVDLSKICVHFLPVPPTPPHMGPYVHDTDLVFPHAHALRLS